jgi:hypothetical protein
MSWSPTRYIKCAAAHLRYLGSEQDLKNAVNDALVGESGALFRAMNWHGQVLDRCFWGGMVVKCYVGWRGYDVEDFAGHSLRAGLATSAAASGKSDCAIMNQTGHRSLPTLRRYIREGNLFHDNAADGLGL